ncbi:hypothetical protein NC99_31400 [Sunxiuqinia dokdonensis]|uniref:Uncharacterized protein n=1 Tax=Sunxiuqinia dokdonensis TaxID=1409788 RepID=A0A0L8V7J3_9BACT|nr:hypothetical protein NC99_31400 [Sunxiuqinia dokdonensis]
MAKLSPYLFLKEISCRVRHQLLVSKIPDKLKTNAGVKLSFY